jgi:hypothetical protein
MVQCNILKPKIASWTSPDSLFAGAPDNRNWMQGSRSIVNQVEKNGQRRDLEDYRDAGGELGDVIGDPRLAFLPRTEE